MDIQEIISNTGKLKAGQRVLLSGTIYTARDAAHARVVDIINKGGKA
ncbi:MAG: fumarate hydratase C-terminal domain-containing protein, partial [Endomicrobia bacterium]|nr:fumarate hydratase C-terminal domain-containing protein [Endomicrobiia bacterium]